MAELYQLPTPQQKWPAESSLFKGYERLSALIPGGEDLQVDIEFADDIWDLAGHRSWKDKDGSQTVIDFTRIGHKWRPAAKEMALLQLNPDLAAERAPTIPMAQSWRQIQEPIAPVTALGNTKMLGHALKIVDERAIERFDSDDWARLTVLLVQPQSTAEKRETSATLSPATGRGRAQQLIALWQVCRIAGRGDLMGSTTPFDGKATTEIYAKENRRNSVRPHAGVGEVLGFCAWVIDHIADDIVDHIDWWVSHTATDPPLGEHELREDMLVHLAQIADDNDGRVPGSRNLNGGLTLAAAPMARLHGVYDANLAFLAGRWARRQLADTVVYDTSLSPCPLPFAEVAGRDGVPRPWAERLLAELPGLDIWQRRLVYCAMYYLSATVMLRDSQIVELPLDCLRTEDITRPDGTSYVSHTLTAYKTKNRSAPVKTQVVVNGRVARIVALLQRLHTLLGFEPYRSPNTGEPVLFSQRLAVPFGCQPRIDARPTLHLDQSFIKVLQEAARALFDAGATARHLEDVKVSMREVRITCAQAYAVREHGQALAAAFGQWDTAKVAAGYIGDIYQVITPFDPAEAIDLWREDKGRRLVTAKADRHSLTGAGLPRLDAAIEGVEEALSNPQPLTPARLKTLGKNNINIEQGPLTLCVFQADGAMCGGKGKPDFRLCLPGQCRNSVMSRSDRARYELMRRQHLELKSAVLRRAADKMDEANPDIAEEFADVDDEGLKTIIAEHIDAYIAAALEDKA